MSVEIGMRFRHVVHRGGACVSPASADENRGRHQEHHRYIAEEPLGKTNQDTHGFLWIRLPSPWDGYWRSWGMLSFG